MSPLPISIKVIEALILLVLSGNLCWAQGQAEEGTAQAQGSSADENQAVPDTDTAEVTKETTEAVRDIGSSKSEVMPTAVVEEEHWEEIKQMRQIEPGFTPKDERAIQIFLLQKAVAETKQNIEKRTEQGKNTRELFTSKFRSELHELIVKDEAGLESRSSKDVDEIIEAYEHALKYHPNNTRFAADALYFLGLYYFERDEKNYFEKLARYNEAREQGREDVEYPEEDFDHTITAYNKLIESYPNYGRLDGAYYLLGLALWYEGVFFEAVEKFQELIKRFPKSRFVEEVWFRLGEFFYDMDEFDDAIRAYGMVANNKASPFYDKAIYKIAWSNWQKDRFMEAARRFIDVIVLASDEKSADSSSGMRAEAIRFVVKSFSEQLVMDEGNKIASSRSRKRDERDFAERMGVKLVERINKYFNDLKNPPFTREIMIETASQMLDESKVDGAVMALDRAITLDPNNAENPRIASQVVTVLQEADRLGEARKRNQELIRSYSKNSAWYLAKSDDYIARTNAREAVRDAMLALAVYYHKNGKELSAQNKKQESADNFRRAASLYISYVREYPERDDVHKALFYFAESAYELGRFRYALDTYQLLKDYPLPMPESFRRDATYNIVFTFRHVLENEAKEGRFKEIDFDNLTSKQRGEKPEQIPELGQRYLNAISEFLELAPDDAQAPVLWFHAAAIYYVYGQSEEAFSRLFFIIDAYPKTSAATVAARLVLDDAIAKEDWPQVLAMSKKFAEANLGGQRKDFARIEGNARFKIARGVFQEASDLHQKGELQAAKAKYKESAEMFKSILADDPKNPNADIMLFNSAHAIAQSGTTTAALPLYKKLYTQYPKSEYAKVARFQEALALEKMLKFAAAAKAYDAIIRLDPKSKSAGDAMLNKALLYEAASDLKNAAIAFSEFARKYKDRPEAPDALLSAADCYKKMGRTSQQITMLEQFIKQYRNNKEKVPAIIEAHVHIGDTYGELKKSTTSAAKRRSYDKAQNRNYRAAVDLFSPELNSPIAAYYAGKAQLILEKPEQDSFKKMKINGRLGKQQAEQMTAMLKKLTDLAAKNEAIIKGYTQPVWNAESLRRIGELYEHLAKSIVNAPCPRDVASVDEFACDEYIVLLEDKAAVLEEKALSAYKQAYEIAMSAYDAPADLVDNILLGLNRLRPGEYKRVGSLIEKHEIGQVYGRGRMLSNGMMAAELHPNEKDPDRTPPVVKEEPTVQPNDELKENQTPEVEQEMEEGALPEEGEIEFEDFEEVLE